MPNGQPLGVEQWGYSTGQADLTTILPFPMTESFISLCCANSYWTNAGCYVSNTAITLSQAQTDKTSTRHDGPLCWLVLGKQPQWGYQVVHGTNPVTYNLPISFTEQPFTVAISTGNGGNHASVNGFTCDSITLVAGTTPNVFDTIGYVIIGQ